MSTPRQQVAEQIRADNPTFRVFEYAKKPANVNVGQPVVSVFRTDVQTDPATVLMLEHSVTVQVFASKTMEAAVEDELDDALDAVLLSLERLGGWALKTAKRASFYDGTFAGWEIEAAAKSPNVYRDTVLREKEQN